MEFRIAATFTDSLARLTGEEQKAVKTTAFDLQMDPVNAGMSLHRLDKQRDKNFWSARASRDLRIIVHKTDSSTMLCYAGHHDDAYAWAERRRIETHPVTGAAQIVEVRELVKEVLVPRYVPEPEPSQVALAAPAAPQLFAHLPEDALLSFGVPAEWLADVRAATEDSLLELADHLPAEAAEALLQLATGSTPPDVPPAAKVADPFEHPDAQRRFRTITNVEELERALGYPWDKWTIFLHPAQRDLVEREYGGPARVAGSAGTGKTIVAIHRAVVLTRSHPDARVLLTTFSPALAHALRIRVRRLIGNEPRLGERLEVEALDAVGERLYAAHFRRREVATCDKIEALIAEASTAIEGQRFSHHFLVGEWEHVVDAWGIEAWEQYRDIARTGRRTKLAEPQRRILWPVFERVYEGLTAAGMVTHAQMFTRLAQRLPELSNPPFDFVVVDEAQDVSVPQLRFLAAIDGGRPDALFFAGDLGQRIFQQPFSWKSLGVDVRGRSRILRINYRTSHQIRRQSDRLLGQELSDRDGVAEDRRGTVSAFNGPEPSVRPFDSEDEEIEAVAEWLAGVVRQGVAPHEVGVFVRSEAQLERAMAAVSRAGFKHRVLDHGSGPGDGDQVSISTMHHAKGLEFRAVVVMACDDEVLPLLERMATATDDAGMEEVYETERHLLYVACTRARDHLLVTSGDLPSEFLDDLRVA